VSEPLPENPPETGESTQFAPGKSGNPGGRPKGLAKRVRELVGADGEDLAKIMLVIAYDEKEATRDRMEAIKWLSDRGWGKAPAFAPIEDDDPLDLAEREATEIADVFDKRLASVHELGAARAKRT
jgi:hypothetical protein